MLRTIPKASYASIRCLIVEVCPRKGRSAPQRKTRVKIFALDPRRYAFEYGSLERNARH